MFDADHFTAISQRRVGVVVILRTDNFDSIEQNGYLLQSVEYFDIVRSK